MSNAPIHRDTDARICSATTTVVGNSDVFANELLVSVDADPNSHGDGALIAHSNEVYADNILTVNHTPDTANADALCPIPPHCGPDTDQGSPNVYTGDPDSDPVVVIPPVTMAKIEAVVQIYIAEPPVKVIFPPQIDQDEQVKENYASPPDEIALGEPAIEGLAIENVDAQVYSDICHPFDGILNQYLLESSNDLWDETGMGGGAASNPKILAIWDSLGFRNNAVWKTDQTAWCAGFVNYVLKLTGYKYVQSARAFDIRDKTAKYEATEIPIAEAKCGDIALWSYSHVNFVYSNEDGRMSFVGGNQSDKATNNNNPSKGAVTHSWKGSVKSPYNPNGKEGGKGAYHTNGTRHDTNLLKCYRPKKIA